MAKRDRLWLKILTAARRVELWERLATATASEGERD